MKSTEKKKLITTNQDIRTMLCPLKSIVVGNSQ